MNPTLIPITDAITAASAPTTKLDAEPVDELRVDVLADARRPEPVLPGWRLPDAVPEREGVGVGEPGPDDRQDQHQQDDAETDDELAVPEREVERLAPSPTEWRNPDRPAERGVELLRCGLDDGHYEPWMPTRVRGSTIT